MSETTNTQPPPDFPPFPEEAQAPPPVSTQTPAPKPKRPLLARIFAIKFWGAIRLLVLCVLVGLIMQVGDFAQDPGQFSFVSFLQDVWQSMFAGLFWVISHGWKPALLGALVVLPIWVLWRLVSLPFRR